MTHCSLFATIMTWRVSNVLMRMIVVAAMLNGCTDGAASETTSTFGHSSVTSSMQQHRFDVQDVAAWRVMAKNNQEERIVVGFVDTPGLCTSWRSPYARPETGFSIMFQRTPLVGGGFMPDAFPFGKYTIGSIARLSDATVDVSAAYHATDATCTESMSHGYEDAKSGWVSLDAINGGVARGTYDLTFDSGRVHGTFEAPLCAVTMDDVTRDRTCGGT